MTEQQQTGRALIDPPGAFDPIEDWKSFVEEMEAVETKSPDVLQAIEQAKAHIAAVAAENGGQSDDDFSDIEG